MKGNYKHGEGHTRLYNIWKSMRQRCSDPSHISFRKYGERGIKVCDEWNNYSVFAAWARANGYSNDLTIDRIDPDGDYTPQNCRWATYKQQNNNRRNNSKIIYNGVTRTMSEWADVRGIKLGTLWNRLRILHWPVEKALGLER